MDPAPAQRGGPRETGAESKGFLAENCVRAHTRTDPVCRKRALFPRIPAQGEKLAAPRTRKVPKAARGPGRNGRRPISGVQAANKISVRKEDGVRSLRKFQRAF